MTLSNEIRNIAKSYFGYTAVKAVNNKIERNKEAAIKSLSDRDIQDVYDGYGVMCDMLIDEVFNLAVNEFMPELRDELTLTFNPDNSFVVLVSKNKVKNPVVFPLLEKSLTFDCESISQHSYLRLSDGIPINIYNKTLAIYEQDFKSQIPTTGFDPEKDGVRVVLTGDKFSDTTYSVVNTPRDVYTISVHRDSSARQFELNNELCDNCILFMREKFSNVNASMFTFKDYCSAHNATSKDTAKYNTELLFNN